jgi:hypothetical protein
MKPKRDIHYFILSAFLTGLAAGFCITTRSGFTARFGIYRPKMFFRGVLKNGRTLAHSLNILYNA